MIKFILNNEEITTVEPSGTALLDFIRYNRDLTGTKIGCREGDCGACTVLAGCIKDNKLQYSTLTSCLTPLGNIHRHHIVTVEGLNLEKGLNPVQEAMAEENATQCGFCTPGFVVSMTGFCLSNNVHSYEEALASVDGNICRCTGYKSIERALRRITGVMEQRKKDVPLIDFLTSNKVLPLWFKDIEQRLKNLKKHLNEPEAENTAAIFVGGGTDLYVQQHAQMVFSNIHFLLNNRGLKGIRQEGNRCIIGASTTVTELLESAIFKKAVPGFENFARLVSSTPIRNIATLAGNFSNASPIGDLTVLFLALDATLHLRNGVNTRRIPLKQFFKAYKQIDKEEDELIEKISFEIPANGYLVNFEKVSKRRNLDIASVNTAVKIEMEGGVIRSATLAAGGVAPVPFFLKNTSALLKDKKIDVDLVEAAVETARAEITPISDARGTAEYKKQLLGQLIKAHFIVLFPMLDIKQLISKS